jgi:hypothetical protein
LLGLLAESGYREGHTNAVERYFGDSENHPGVSDQDDNGRDRHGSLGRLLPAMRTHERTLSGLVGPRRGDLIGRESGVQPGWEQDNVSDVAPFEKVALRFDNVEHRIGASEQRTDLAALDV